MERGLVIATRFTYDGTSKLAVFPSTSIDPLLRPYTLFWDKLDLPSTMIDTGLSQDMQFLADTGVLTRTLAPMAGLSGDMGAVYVEAQFAAFKQLDAVEPGVWAVAQNAENLYTPPAFASSGAVFWWSFMMPCPCLLTTLR